MPKARRFNTMSNSKISFQIWRWHFGSVPAALHRLHRDRGPHRGWAAVPKTFKRQSQPRVDGSVNGNSAWPHSTAHCHGVQPVPGNRP